MTTIVCHAADDVSGAIGMVVAIVVALAVMIFVLRGW